MAIEYSGLTHDLYFGTKDGKNFKKILGVHDLEPDNDYSNGEKIDNVEGVTVGTSGAVQVGLKKGSSTQVPGTLKLVPKLASQAKHTIYILDADATLTDWSLEDGLTEYEVTVNGQFVEGELTFA